MKHLKPYNENVSTLSELKKYIIIKSNIKNLPFDTPLLLLEVISVNENKNSIYFIQHYHYKNNHIDKDSTIYTKKEILYNVTDKWDILYTSDNLKECIEMMPIIFNSNKFNL